MALRYVVGTTIRPVVSGQVRNASALSLKDVLASQPTAEVTSLKNGFRVVSEDNGKNTATIGVFIETGSRFENDGNNGVAHFLERLIHRGTGKRSAAALEGELEAIGAKLNSFTGRDQSAVFVQANAKDVEKVLDILADVLRNSKLDSIDATRAELLKELDESDEKLQTVLFDNLHATAFQGTGLALSPLGTSSSLKAITSQAIKEWQEDHYRPVRMVLSAVGGGCSSAKLSQLAEKYFGDLSNDYPRKVPEVGGLRFTGSEYRYRNDNIPHMYAAYAVEGVPYGHPDALPLRIADVFMGQWDTTHALTRTAPSRLVQKISHDHGLHLLQHFNINYKDTGLWGIYFVSDGKDLADTTGIMKSVQKEWKHLATSASEEEIAMARNKFRTQFYQNIETNTQKATFNATELLYTGSVRALADVEEAISRVDHNSIREAVSRHVYDRDLAAAGVGRTEAFPNYAPTRYRMSWWRL